MNEFDRVLKSITKNNILITFGTKIFDNCFDFSLSEVKYVECLRHVKNLEKWKLKSKQNIKTFAYYDLKLIVDDEGNMKLQKYIVDQYFDILNNNNQGIRITNYKKIDNLDINIFPGLDKIHDIKKIREIIFEKNDITITFLVVNHTNKDITFEIFIETYKKNIDNLLKELPKFIKLFNLSDLSKISKTELENDDILSLSIL